MNKGIVVFAHNNRNIDYALMSIISGGLAKKHLNVPVSLITDNSTIEWMKSSNIYDKALGIFENIILTDRPITNNSRLLFDGDIKEIVPFNNFNRDDVWELTPYDRTLLIDSDYFILSDNLNEFWNIDSDLLIAESITDVVNDTRLGYLDKNVSETGVKMHWATTVMFTKNKKTKAFFETVKLIKENYSMFGDIYRFNSFQYRNDIAFSIARHIFDGFNELAIYSLPSIFTTSDKDLLEDVRSDGNLIFLTSERFDNNYFPISIKNRDVHIMNKQSITRNADKFLELI